MKYDDSQWFSAPMGEVHSCVVQRVREIEENQAETYERFLKLAYLYNPNGRGPMYGNSSANDSRVIENFVASNVDTVHAALTAGSIRARFMTDNADWSTQRRARHMDFWSNGIAKKIGAISLAERTAKDAPLKGMAFVKVWVDEFGQIRCVRLLAENVIVDEEDCRNGEPPRHLHHREVITVEEAVSRFPDKEEEVRSSVGLDDKSMTHWAGYRPVDRDDVVLIESWCLPIGKKGRKGYRPGRHTIVTSNYDLLDEPWEEEFIPIAIMYWVEPDVGFFGISLAERLAGHQRAQNKLNVQKDRLIDQWAFPVRFVRPGDANMTVKTINRMGTIAVCRQEFPKTEVPPAISPDIWRRGEELTISSSHESGVSRMAAHAAKPGGLDSGRALREYRDQTTQRFARQEKNYERFVLRIIELIVWCGKKLGKKAPTVVRKSRFGSREIGWPDVDLGEVSVQIQAASDLANTSTGRQQLATELAQAGVISQDEARRLMQHPDIDRAMSIWTAAIEHIDRVLEDGLDGQQIMPDPYMHLKMAVWRGQMQYQLAEDDGAPEEILEILRQFVDTAAWMTSLNAPDPSGQLPAPVSSAPASDMGAGPMMTGAGVTPTNIAG